MFKKKYFTVGLVFVLLIFGAITVAQKVYNEKSKQTISELRSIVDERGTPSGKLQEILNFFEIKHDNTLNSIVEETQKIFRRADGKERWQLDECFAEKRTALWPLLENIGLMSEVCPQYQQYDCIVLLGATLPTFRNRIRHLLEIWNKGIQFKKIIFLGGQRPLDPQQEPQESFLQEPNFIRNDWKLNGSLPQTEIEMMKMVYDQANIPNELRNIPILFINAPMQKQADGTIKRPTTADTICQWLSEDSSLVAMDSPRILCISSQPHVGYQDAVIRTFVPKSFIIDTIGLLDEHKTTKLAEILDALARWLYQEKERRRLR